MDYFDQAGPNPLSGTMSRKSLPCSGFITIAPLGHQLSGTVAGVFTQQVSAKTMQISTGQENGEGGCDGM